MSDPARRRATYEDVLAAAPHHVAEIVDGELHLQPRPAAPTRSCRERRRELAGEQETHAGHAETEGHSIAGDGRGGA